MPVFDAIAKKADGYLAHEVQNLRDQFLNSTVKGTGYERALGDVVKGVVPPMWRVGWGEVVDPYGQRSGQTDLVVALPTQPSMLHRDDGNWLFLSPSVVAIGESKMLLTLERLRECLDGPAIEWAALDRAIQGQMAVGPGGDDAATWERRLPVFVFAHEGPTLDSVQAEINSRQDPLVDAVFIRDRGALLRSPGPDSSFLWVEAAGDTERPPPGTWIQEPETRDAAVTKCFLQWLTYLPVWLTFEQRPLRQYLM